MIKAFITLAVVGVAAAGYYDDYDYGYSSGGLGNVGLASNIMNLRNLGALSSLRGNSLYGYSGLQSPLYRQYYNSLGNGGYGLLNGGLSQYYRNMWPGYNGLNGYGIGNMYGGLYGYNSGLLNGGLYGMNTGLLSRGLAGYGYNTGLLNRGLDVAIAEPKVIRRRKTY